MKSWVEKELCSIATQRVIVRNFHSSCDREHTQHEKTNSNNAQPKPIFACFRAQHTCRGATFLESYLCIIHIGILVSFANSLSQPVFKRYATRNIYLHRNAHHHTAHRIASFTRLNLICSSYTQVNRHRRQNGQKMALHTEMRRRERKKNVSRISIAKLFVTLFTLHIRHTAEAQTHHFTVSVRAAVLVWVTVRLVQKQQQQTSMFECIIYILRTSRLSFRFLPFYSFCFSRHCDCCWCCCCCYFAVCVLSCLSHLETDSSHTSASNDDVMRWMKGKREPNRPIAEPADAKSSRLWGTRIRRECVASV